MVKKICGQTGLALCWTDNAHDGASINPGVARSHCVSGRSPRATLWSAVDPAAPWREATGQAGESFGQQFLDSILKSIEHAHHAPL